MGQTSSQALAERSPAPSDNSAQDVFSTPLGSPQPDSPLKRVDQHLSSTRKAPASPPSRRVVRGQVATRKRTRRSLRPASPSPQPEPEPESEPESDTIVVTPDASMGKSKSKSKPTKQSQRNSTSKQRSRTAIATASKDQFLSALNGDIVPETPTKPRSAAKASRSGLPANSGAESADGPEPELELLVSPPRKRKLTYSSKTPNGGLAKKLRRHAMTPEGEVGDGEGASEVGEVVASKPGMTKARVEDGLLTPSTESTWKPTMNIEVRIPAKLATIAQGSQLRRPTQETFSDLQIPTPMRSRETFSSRPDDAFDQARRKAVAENYPKVIGTVARQRSNRSIEDVMENGGPLIQQELDQAYELKEDFCREHSMTSGDFDSLLHATIKENPKARVLWNLIYETYPYRKNHTLLKIFRRHFHPYSRPVGWTKQEDQDVLDLYATLGNKWLQIGSRLDRRPEEVRDRWRNYLRYSNRKKERWDPEEMLALGTAVGDLLYKVKCDRRDEARKQGIRGPIDLNNNDYRKLINWHAVAQNVSGRSRLQCHQRWIELERLGATSFESEVQDAEQRATGGRREPSQDEPELLEGDKLRLCKAISKTGVKVASDLSWSDIRSGSSKLEIFPKKLLRRTWNGLIADHLTGTEVAEEQIEVASTASLIKKRLKKATPKDSRKRYWAKIGTSTPPPSTVSKHVLGLDEKLRATKAQRRRDRKESIGAYKSEEFIVDSDSDGLE